MGAYGAENSVDQFFHSWFFDGTAWDSVRDSQYGPAPGFLVGGANSTQYDWDERCPGISVRCGTARPSPPYGQPGQKAYKDFNDGWPLNSWPITENSNGYQTAYIRLLARYVSMPQVSRARAVVPVQTEVRDDRSLSTITSSPRRSLERSYPYKRERR